MRKGIYLLPNILTLCGMFCGFYAIIAAFKGDYIYAAWAILIANIFDGLDGWIARLTHSTTRFGIELDSLSDLVTFGIAPAVLIYTWALYPFERVGWGAAFLFVICGALRLARFNVQMGSAERKAFTGMPIPGAGSVIAAFVLFYIDTWGSLMGKNYFILTLTFVLAILMVSTLKYHGTKEIDFRERKPFYLLVALVIIVALIFMHPPLMLFVLSMGYMLWGIGENAFIYYRKIKEGTTRGAG
ncbi:MAG TPA: CDP-diacylglycerol--serine O-phosphatidyltransferase [Nitrospiraceae bacterium]|nr:CDP-diacylglycerol--serine O-phosphatidyltransferase [Nitrospiraceae bacterium]